MYAGFKPDHKPAATKQNTSSEVERLTSELAELKKAVEKVLSSQNDRRQQKRYNGGKREWHSPPPKIKERYILPPNSKKSGCWFCGEDKFPRHNIARCPKRLAQEAARPGSTVRNYEAARLVSQQEN